MHSDLCLAEWRRGSGLGSGVPCGEGRGCREGREGQEGPPAPGPPGSERLTGAQADGPEQQAAEAEGGRHPHAARHGHHHPVVEIHAGGTAQLRPGGGSQCPAGPVLPGSHRPAQGAPGPPASACRGLSPRHPPPDPWAQEGRKGWGCEWRVQEGWGGGSHAGVQALDGHHRQPVGHLVREAHGAVHKSPAVLGGHTGSAPSSAARRPGPRTLATPPELGTQPLSLATPLSSSPAPEG